MARFTTGSWSDDTLEVRMRPRARRNSMGCSLTYTPGPVEPGDLNSVVSDAFTYRKRLVVLKFAQQTFYISIKNMEASSDEEAMNKALARATQAYRKTDKPLGNLMGYEVHEDTDAVRAKFKLDGSQNDTSRQMTVSRLWRNAA